MGKEEPMQPISIKEEDLEEEASQTKYPQNADGECNPVNYSPSYFGNQDGDSSSYHGSSSASVPSYQTYNGTIHGYSSQGNGGDSIISSSTMQNSILRTWNTDPGQSIVTRNNLVNVDSTVNDFPMEAVLGTNLQVQVPLANMPSVYKPIDHSVNDFANSFSNDCKVSRRGSNASVGSLDSNYLSGNETTSGSRRGSNNSIYSLVSCGKSATLPSPLPSRNLSPRRITQTVIEGEVLDNYNSSGAANTGLGPNRLEHTMELPLRDAINMDTAQMNMHSRVSSGYGSQTTYFPAKSPNSRVSPTPSISREVRRASEGNVRRVSDSAFSQTNQRMSIRRASEPVRVSNIIEETPRRHSMSTYNVLPTPAAMHSISGENPVLQANNLNNIVFQNSSQSQQIPNQRFNCGNLILMQQQQPSNTLDQASHFSQKISYDQPDSTVPNNADVTYNGSSVRMEEDHLSTFVDRFEVSSNLTGKGSMPTNASNQIMGQQIGSMNSLPNSQLGNNCIVPQHLQTINASRLTHMQPSVSESSQFFPPHNIIPHPPSTFTLHWQNSHFGEKSLTRMMEADSTEDKDIEDIMINSMAALNTLPPSRPQTNMAINRMDTLLCSFAEENKYFENTARYH